MSLIPKYCLFLLVVTIFFPLPTTPHSFPPSYSEYKLSHDNNFGSESVYKSNVATLSSRTSPGCEYSGTAWLDIPPSRIRSIFNSTFDVPTPTEGSSLQDVLQELKDFITDHDMQTPATVQVKSGEGMEIDEGLDWSVPSRNPSSRNLVTSPRNQGLCGSCYAFSSLGSLETSLALSSGNSPQPLSVEEVVSCSTNNLGCTGGNPLLAMEWVTKHGVGLEKDYKYKSINRMPGEENSCKSDLNRGVRAYVKQYAIVQPTVEGIKEALKYSTVAVGIDGTEVGLLGYRSGVYGDRQEEVEGCKVRAKGSAKGAA